MIYLKRNTAFVGHIDGPGVRMRGDVGVRTYTDPENVEVIGGQYVVRIPV